MALVTLMATKETLPTHVNITSAILLAKFIETIQNKWWKGMRKYFEHPIVLKMFNNNKQFYESIVEQDYSIERLVNWPNRQPSDVIKVLAFGILGDQW